MKTLGTTRIQAGDDDAGVVAENGFPTKISGFQEPLETRVGWVGYVFPNDTSFQPHCEQSS